MWFFYFKIKQKVNVFFFFHNPVHYLAMFLHKIVFLNIKYKTSTELKTHKNCNNNRAKIKRIFQRCNIFLALGEESYKNKNETDLWRNLYIFFFLIKGFHLPLKHFSLCECLYPQQVEFWSIFSLFCFFVA